MDKPINVALVCTSLNQMGGKNVHFKNMYLNLIRDDRFRITIILTSSMEHAHRGFMIREGVRSEDVIFIPINKKRLIFPYLIELRRIFIIKQINIVHTFQIQSDIFGGIASLLSGVKCIISQQESKAIEENISLTKNLSYRIANFCIKNIFRKTVVVSEGLKNELISEGFRPEKKIELIPLGVDLPEEFKNKEYLFVGLRDKKPLIGTIARLNKEKGIDHFINAIPFVLEKFPEARFTIIGRGDEKLSLEKQADGLKLGPKIKFGEASWSSSIYNALENIDIFVMPSLREGCPTALLEALALSRPVVASNIEGIRDIIEDGNNGLMVDTLNPRLFAEKILYLCDSPEKAISMGLRGRKKVLSQFTLAEEMEHYRKLYREVLLNN